MLKGSYETFIHKSRYAKHIPSTGGREDWEQTVGRYVDYWFNKGAINTHDAGKMYEAFLTQQAVPSMRCLMTAGAPLDRDNVAGFNCSYVAIDNLIAFDETMYVLMCGTGVGFSVERQFINLLPVVGEADANVGTFPGVGEEELSYIYDNVIHVMDSKYGWASAFRHLLVQFYNGNFDATWDVSRVRPAGATLKTFGGRASGPEPLVDLFKFTRAMFINAAGRKLNSLECHDLVCKVADIVVVGGVRRSALISLSNLSDPRIRGAKSGEWWNDNPQRALANNSACYTEKPDVEIFMDEWKSLIQSKSGERGIFSRDAANKLIPARRTPRDDFGCNPCSEIILRSRQFCNLAEAIVRSDDTLLDLIHKVKKATIFGTLQATLTDFVYLSDEWKINTEEEALLGVSLTGICDHPVLNGSRGEKVLEEYLIAMKEQAIATNIQWAEKLGINPAAAVTCVKPSGTVSQLTDTASGIHPRYSEYYIRTVRADKKDPLAQWMKEKGFPVEDCFMKPESVDIFSFPMKSPEGALLRNDRTAIEQLELWKTYATVWCEHKPSITVYVKEHEWLEVGAWVYSNFDIMSGVSFLPHSDHSYKQAPYQEVTETEYETLKALMPDVNWNHFTEELDTTVGMQTAACSAGGCEVVDLL